MAQLTIRNTLIASFSAVAMIAVLLAGATFLSAGGGGESLDTAQITFVESLARVEGELTSAVADLAARNDVAWPPTLDEAFQGFADAAGSTDVTAFSESVNLLLQSGQELRGQWPAAVAGDATAVLAAAEAYRTSTTAIQQLETQLVGDRMTAGAAAAGMAGLLRILAGAGTLLAAGVAGSACWYCIRSVLVPLQKAGEVVGQAAAGNLTVRIGVTGGEVGSLCQGIDRLLDSTHRAMHGVMQESLKLAASATDLASSASSLTQGAKDLAGDATQALGSAESVSTTMTTMTASAEEMTIGLQAIAASATQLTTSIQAINDTAGTASAAAESAAAIAADTNGTVSHLGNAADEIGNVIDVIQDIAEQSNLLALNATIEAARAGEAGKGFAVVATEVKDLAKQTGNATEEIRQRIEAIRASTGESVEAIGRISDAIAEIGSVARTIAAAVGEQNGATQEIARNVGASATAAERVSSGLAQSAGASEETSRTIANVDRNTRESVDALQLMQSASQDVARMAEALNEQVSSFQM